MTLPLVAGDFDLSIGYVASFRGLLVIGLRNLGVVFTEMAWLDDLAKHCAADRRFDGLFCGSRAKVSKGTGGSVNPVFIKQRSQPDGNLP